jgi:hypothetical protein
MLLFTRLAPGKWRRRDLVAVVAANLVSFLVGLALFG